MVNLEKEGGSTSTSVSKRATIHIPTIDDVKNFVTIAMKYTCDIILVAGRYAIDGKSIMGVFSIDVTKPVELRLDIDGPKDDRDEFLAEIDKYIVKN